MTVNYYYGGTWWYMYVIKLSLRPQVFKPCSQAPPPKCIIRTHIVWEVESGDVNEATLQLVLCSFHIYGSGYYYGGTCIYIVYIASVPGLKCLCEPAI